jgi:pimeloyl-ACP methyl ester carboxylesterase
MGLAFALEQPRAVHERLPLGRYVLDVGQGCLLDAGGQRVTLRRQSMDVLLYLARTPNRTVSKDELFGALWPGRVVTDDSLVQCVREIRRVLGDEGRLLLRTDARQGYRLHTREAAAADQPAGAGHPTSVEAEPFDQSVHFASGGGGTRIAYGLSGRGPTVVRAAHWMTHLEWDWRSPVYGPGIRAMSSTYRLLRYDGRGCGLSDRQAVPMGTLDDEVADLEAVVDAAGADRFVLIGRSQGGAIAIRYAARHPDRVGGLILSGAYARGALERGPQSWPFDEVIEVTRQLQLGWGQDNLAFRRLVTSFMFPSATPEQVSAFNLLQHRASTPQDAATLYLMMAHYDASADLAKVRCPTLVLHSPHDNVAPFEEGRYIAARIAGARFEPFESLNHNPLPGEPAYDRVGALMREFIDAVSDGTPQPAG